MVLAITVTDWVGPFSELQFGILRYIKMDES